jgi:hypothetical protein
VLDSVLNRRGLTFSVEIARQGGKNELSAQLEMLLLTLFITEPWNLIKCSPTFKPQALISMRRLQDRLNEAGFAGLWRGEQGHIIRLGNARQIFLSADVSANVVGNTAHLLLEIDESQDVSREKYTKDFKPMGATTNVTTIHYGTAWDDTTLLEEVKQTNLELERRDGMKRHFQYAWETVARHNPDYRAYVAGERARLGEDHPLFRTQYCLEPVQGGGGFLSPEQIAQIAGDHPRQRWPETGLFYVAGIDLGGEDEADAPRAARDSTVVTIGELDSSVCDAINKLPRLKVVEHYRWTGVRHPDLYPRLVDLLMHVWHCRRAVVDATGLGQPVASFLRSALGSRVIPFTFTAPAKSRLGFNLLAAVNSGRLKAYRDDGSAEYREFRAQLELARSRYRPNRTLNFFVEPARGHDDFLMSLALAVEAANEYSPREAKGR